MTNVVQVPVKWWRVLAFCILASPALGDAANTPATAAARPIVELRLRSETVDQAGLSHEASAETLRARVGVETRAVKDTTLLAEGELLWPFDSGYNDTMNGKTSLPVVADAETYELNRLQVMNRSLKDTLITLGRQRIELDDQRFIGSSGWRQNEQTFDALRIVNKAIGKLTLDFAYIEQVNRVFGKDSPAGRYTGSSYIANMAWPLPFGTLGAYTFLLDFNEAPLDSSATVGLRLTGDAPAKAIQLAYAVSYARQQDRARNPLDYQDDYYNVELTGTFRQASLGAGIEVLQGDGVRGFATPLATLHKFQGWADKFLTTPPNGLEDRYVSLGYRKKAVSLLESWDVKAIYHSFESQRAAFDYGREIDLQLQAKWSHFNAVMKYADYRAGALATDTSKFWIQLEFVH